MDEMDTRSKRRNQKNSSLSGESDSDDLDRTVVPVGSGHEVKTAAKDLANVLSNSSVSMSSDQLNTILQGIVQLQKSMHDLRQDAFRELDELRLQVNAETAADNQVSLKSPLTNQLKNNDRVLADEMQMPNSSGAGAPPPPAYSLEQVALPPQPTSNAANGCMFQQHVAMTSQPAHPTSNVFSNVTLQPQVATPPQYLHAAHGVPRLSYVEDNSAKLFPLPIFSGNPEEWPLFNAVFIDSSNELGYNNKQNLIRLQKALKGEARESVLSMLIFPDNVSQIMSELEFNYGRPELLIRTQMVRIQQFPQIFDNRLENILPFANKVRNIVAFFKSSKLHQHLMNPMLLEQLVVKLPQSKQYEWAQHAAVIVPYPTIESFANWVSDLAKVISLMPCSSIANGRQSSLPTAQPRQGQAPQQQPRTTHTNYQGVSGAVRRVLYSNESTAIQSVNDSRCTQCSQSHKLSECADFKSLKVDDKWDFVKKNLLCFACLCKGHGLGQCRKKIVCGIDDCKRMHNKLLHSDLKLPTQKQSCEHVLNCRSNYQSGQLFKILPITLFGPKGSMSSYAMFDEGSSLSLLEEDAAEALGLKGQLQQLTLQWFADNVSTQQSKKVAFSIKGNYANAADFHLKNIRTVKGLNLPTQSFNKNVYEHLSSLPLANYDNVKPVLMLGLDNCHLGIFKGVVEAKANEPVAAFTKLGWVAFGPVNQRNTEQRVFHVHEIQTLKQLNKTVDDFLMLENLGVNNSAVLLESDEDSRAKNILAETTKFIGNRYEVGLLWRRDDLLLPSNFETAKQRLINVERKMSKDPKHAEKYKTEINKYINKNYARLLTQDEAALKGSRTWYLPHFGVVNPNKPQKLRIVFDAAAVTSGVSLNSELLKGPEHAQSLLAILFKFRQRRVAVAGDIQEMFSQIKIRADDQDAQRFLWRDGDATKPIQTYCMTSMIFGAACSPCCAEYIKNINAATYSESMPKGASAIIHNTYVDDIVVSFDEEQEAEITCLEAKQICAAAGFNLRNFVSNSKKVQATLNGEDQFYEQMFAMDRQCATEKILGLFWNIDDDTLRFNFQFHKVPCEVLQLKKPPTKREMLSLIMSVFDPVGLLGNFMICTKLMLQSTWKLGIDWEDEIPPQLCGHWWNWWKEYGSVKKFAVPRCYSSLLTSADEIQLHVFVDASSSAYAAVAYLRIKKQDCVDVAFVAAKTRCAPIKSMTIPRLELQAAVLGIRLKTLIEENHEFIINKTTYWSDSKTVILWIRSHTRQYKQFVACRISEILSYSKPEEWRWLPTNLNVADDATRAKMPYKFDAGSRWIYGPEFLRDGEQLWPQEAGNFVSDDFEQEIVANRVLILTKPTQHSFDYTKYSSFMKMKRVMAWILRFIHNAKVLLSKRETGELVASELERAEKTICRQIQNEVFVNEIIVLRQGKQLPKSSAIYQLSPIIDDDNLLKVRGRIDAAYCLPITARRPIIMPQDHVVTRRIVNDIHCQKHHQNDLLTINELRQRFWIPHVRAILRTCKKSCLQCIQSRAKPVAPLMGQLPMERVTPYVRPFSYSGVDYCGPFFVTIGRRREKRWVALYTCLTTRAVHLEVAEDLSTDAFLITLRNFINRRGTPVRMRSDNGTNFVGAQKELKPENRLFDFDKIQIEMSKANIDWIFNCPGNPSAGGCWERLVQCVKRLFSNIFKEEAPRLETFRSVLIEAENIINSRPLTELPITVDEEEPLTPNHFLLGCLNSTQTPCLDGEKICLRKQWRIAQNLKDRLWKRWTVEYLPRLLQRSKWREEVNPLQPGQLVIICDPSQPRSQWRKGRVTNTYKAKDGQVRTADVMTAQGQVRRPASKLAALSFGEIPVDFTRGGMSPPSN